MIKMPAAIAICFAAVIPARRDTAEAAPMPAEKGYVNGLGIKMVRIRPGTFPMGSEDGDFDEQPVHEVTMSRGFYMSETEVTAEQFGQFRPDFVGNEDCRPYAAGMSWDQAEAFCKWLSSKEGKIYRLPTEAQWEYACRAGTVRADKPPEAETPNPWGLKNMRTRVAEWCRDWHGAYPEDRQVEPVGPDRGWMKVVRGGGLDTFKWDEPYYRRSTNRAAIAPSFCPPPPEYQTKMTDVRNVPDRTKISSYLRKAKLLGRHFIGFRVVEAPASSGKPFRLDKPALMRCVKQEPVMVDRGPESAQPYYKVRRLFPYGLDVVKVGWKVGLEPGVFPQHHNVALAALPNGDMLAFYYNRPADTDEREPILSIVGLRWRRGAEQWDMPSPWPDFLDANDEAPLIWNDKGVLWLFWGCPRIREIHPFQWTVSNDNGATWGPIRFPVFESPLGSYSAQPITSAFRGPDGTIYVAVDGSGDSSVLFAGSNDGETWIDTGGRTRGRHSAFVLLDEHTILAYGGKNDDIDGFMPLNVSRDWGRSWQVSKSSMPRLGGGQRPSLIKLASGRLLYAGDLWAKGEGGAPQADQLPQGFVGRGGYVGLSDDNGKSWRVRKLSDDGLLAGQDHWALGNSVGYVIACQSADRLIHILTTSELHITFNEQWVLHGGKANKSEVRVRPDTVRQYSEHCSDGQLKVTYSAGTGQGGRYLLDGKEIWYYETGRRQWEVTYNAGRKIGAETYWSRDGAKKWQWEHEASGTSTWNVFAGDGKVKAESRWRGKRYLSHKVFE